jgi:hypothetical protein
MKKAEAAQPVGRLKKKTAMRRKTDTFIKELKEKVINKNQNYENHKKRFYENNRLGLGICRIGQPDAFGNDGLRCTCQKGFRFPGMDN